MYFFVIRIMIQVFIMLLLSCITSGEVEYYVIRNETTWDEATASWTLATPDIIYSGTSYTADVNVSNLGLNQGDKLWLGYFTAYTIFQYIDCMKVMDVISSANYSIHAQPGECYSACGMSGIFGMKLIADYQSQCFCLGSHLDLTRYQGSGCYNGCLVKESVACGGDQYASIYEPVLDLPFQKVQQTSAVGSNGDCVEYDPRSGNLYWRNCSTSLQIICRPETGGDLIPLKSDTQYQYNNWVDSTTACFKASLYPVTYRSVNRPYGNLTSTLWTGMFRSLVFYKYNGKVEPQHHSDLKVEEGRGYLEFFSGSNKTYYSLCQRELTTELPTSTYTKQSNLIKTTTASKDTEQSSEEMINTTTSTNQTTQPTFTSPKTTTHTSTNIAETTSDNGLVYVGLSGGLLLLTLVVIIVVVVVIRRRRRKEIKRRQRGNDVNGSDIGTKNDVNVVYQNQPHNIEESRSTKDGSHVMYLNQPHTFKDDAKNDYIHPIDDMYDECKEADMKTNINVQPEHDDENEYFYPEQGPYEDLKQSDSKTYSQLQTDTTKDYDDDSEYLYPAQGPYEDLKLSDSSTYSQLQTNDQPTNVTHT